MSSPDKCNSFTLNTNLSIFEIIVFLAGCEELHFPWALDAGLVEQDVILQVSCAESVTASGSRTVQNVYCLSSWRTLYCLVLCVVINFNESEKIEHSVCGGSAGFCCHLLIKISVYSCEIRDCAPWTNVWAEGRIFEHTCYTLELKEGSDLVSGLKTGDPQISCYIIYRTGLSHEHKAALSSALWHKPEKRVVESN